MAAGDVMFDGSLMSEMFISDVSVLGSRLGGAVIPLIKKKFFGWHLNGLKQK